MKRFFRNSTLIKRKEPSDFPLAILAQYHQHVAALKTGPLDELPMHQEAKILELDPAHPFLQRLYDFGLLPGTTVKLVGKAPLGSPLIIAIRGGRFSIRKQEARQIQVEWLPLTHTQL